MDEEAQSVLWDESRGRRVPSQRRLENASLLLAGGGLVIGAGVGVVALGEHTPFTGQGATTIVEVAALSAGALVMVVALSMLLVLRSRILPWHGEVHVGRRILNLAGLTLLMGSLVLFAILALGRVAAAAFVGLQLDRWSGAAFVALSCAMCVYFASAAVGRLNAESLSVLVSLFLVLGALMSMVNASDQEWWRVHFSSLGMAWDYSGFTFNYTLVLTGVVIVTLADFLTHDMHGWLGRTGQGIWKAHVVRAGLVLMGVMLAGVGLIPVTVSHRGHLFVTYIAVGGFIVLAVLSPLILRRIPWAFRLVSFGTLGFIALLWYLHRELRYLSTTGFEMIAVATVLTWLVLFIRTIVAAGRDLPPPAPDPEPWLEAPGPGEDEDEDW